MRIVAVLIALTTVWAVSPARAQLPCPVPDGLEIAAEDSFFPYTGMYDGALRGFSLDIVTAAFDAVGCSVTYRPVPYNRCVQEVQAGRRLGCFNTTDSAENRGRYVFHDVPLFRGAIKIYAHPDRTDAWRGDFHRGRFAVVRGYTYTDAFDADPDISKIRVDSDFQTLAMVARKRADFAVVYKKVAQFHISSAPEQIDPAPVAVHDLVEFDLFISFTRKTPDRSRRVASLLDRGLRLIRQNGTYADIETAWDQWLTVDLATGAPPPHWQP